MFTYKSPTSQEFGSPKLNWTEKDHECSKVEQAHKDACDIKSKILHFMQEPPVPQSMPDEGIDLTILPDAVEAAAIAAEGQRAWESIPSKIRSEFSNDKEKFLAAALDPKQKDRLLDMGFDASYLPSLPDAPASIPEEPASAPPSPPEE